MILFDPSKRFDGNIRTTRPPTITHDCRSMKFNNVIPKLFRVIRVLVFKDIGFTSCIIKIEHLLSDFRSMKSLYLAYRTNAFKYLQDIDVSELCQYLAQD